MSLNKLPKISIITPSYNQGNYLEQTLLSIIEQGYDNYELIVMDGGSIDNSVEILKKYDKYITFWESKKDNGQSDAINKGLEYATGHIFNWINSDDFLEPGSLLHIGNYFLDNPNMDILCGYTRCFYDEDNTTSHVYRMGLKENATKTVLSVEMNQPGTFYRTDKVKCLGGINTSLRYIFDNELWFRYLALYGIDKIGTTNKQLAQFRLHKSSKTVFDGYQQFEKEANDIWLHLAKQLELPFPLIDCIKDNDRANKYLSNPWETPFLNKESFIDYFAAKYMITLLGKGEKKLAKKGLDYKRLQKGFKWDRIYISAWLRLNVFL